MFLRMFGIGVSDAITGGQTEGVITDVKTCWWLKVNTKQSAETCSTVRYSLISSILPTV